MDHYWDVLWCDSYAFVLYTRGGPYWQTAKIPFSKFFLTAKGSIQNKQEPIRLDKVKWIGISVAEPFKGPFRLEMDWMGLGMDKGLDEDFAYELYKAGPNKVY